MPAAASHSTGGVLQPKSTNQAHAKQGQLLDVAEPQDRRAAVGRSFSPDPRDPDGSVAPSPAAAAAATLCTTPPRAHTNRSATRASFNDAARPNASVGRVKTLGGRQPLRAPPAAEFKVVLVGSSNAGKTSLAYRYVCGGFRDATCPTVGAAFNCVYEDVALPEARKAAAVPAAQRRRFGVSSARSTTPTPTTTAAGANDEAKATVKVGLWDTAGQEQYADLVSLYFRDAHAVIFVVDSSRRDALDDLTHWIQRVSAAAPPHVLRYLAVSKCDLPDNDRWVELDDAINFVSTVGTGDQSYRYDSPGRSSVATTFADPSHALNTSMAGGRAVSVAASVATIGSARRGGFGAATPMKVFEVSSVSGDGVAELFATVAADAFTRHKAEEAAKNPEGARHDTVNVRRGAQHQQQQKKRKQDRRCC